MSAATSVASNGVSLPAWRDRLAMELLYGGGLRVSELVSLNYGDVDFDGGVARVMGKGRKERLCPLGKVAVAVMKHFRDHHALNRAPGDPVMVNSRHGRLGVSEVQKLLKRYLAHAGLPLDLPDLARMDDTIVNGTCDTGLDAVKPLAGETVIEKNYPNCFTATGLADALKASPEWPRALEGKSIALIFEQPSTRTRVSFEVGIARRARGLRRHPRGTVAVTQLQPPGG